ncbi:putative nuclease HARBI1 [Prorops nasuta]|uniref:putative nuclease HARBI1 n=1 Tax=Prorops nasuta TaxID=863751 RepID=UPI0034D01609
MRLPVSSDNMDLLQVWNVIAEDSEEESEDLKSVVGQERQQHLRIEGFFENTVLYYSLTDFKSHFRLSQSTFERILEKVGPCLVRRDGCPKVQPDKQFAIALWVLGNQEVYRSIADRFDLSKSTLWECVFNVAFVFLTNHVKEYIKWPEPQQILRNQHDFLNVANFPGVVRVIDGSHIPISAPIDYPNSYVNRKGFHSVILQGICDNNMKFIDVYAGYCGSVHEARVWSVSDIKQSIDQNVDRYFPENTHLIGDSAYPLLNTRIIIERTFGLLKARFRKLHFIYMYNTDMVPLLILSCCILHNMCIDCEDEAFNVDSEENTNLNNNI